MEILLILTHLSECELLLLFIFFFFPLYFPFTSFSFACASFQRTAEA